MDSEKIDELLQRYWDGETSLRDEEELQELFRQPEVQEDYRESAALFRYFEASRRQTLNDVNFERDLRRKIAGPAKGRLVTLAFNSMRIAAGILVLVAAIWLVRLELRGTNAGQTDTFDDPKVAFEETKKALMIISRSFNTAEEQARKINLFNEAQQELQQKDQPAEL